MVLSIRNIAAFFMSAWFIASGRTRKIRKQAANGEFILSVYFHDPDKKLFESTVRWFLRNGFHFISVAELNEILRGRKPFPTSAVVLTADDGWKNNKENIVAVANQYKVPFTIFASTRPIETGEGYWWSYISKAHEKGAIATSVSALKKVPNEERLATVAEVRKTITLSREALTIDELKEVANGNYVSIGSHTVTHPILSKCNDNTAAYEITESRKILEQWLNRPVTHFAYPNGDYGNREINTLKDAGYEIAFSTIPDYIRPGDQHNLYAVPRFDVLENISFAENICRMTGIWFNRSGAR